MSTQPSNPKEWVTPTDQERAELLTYAKETLRSGLRHFLETGDVPGHASMGGCTHGPLRDARSIAFTTRGVAIYRPSERELETSRAWHDYCSEHGYPCGEGTEGYPPQPERGDGVWAGLTWAAVRKELRVTAAQLTLEQMEIAA